MTPAVEHEPGSSDPARDSAPDHAHQSAPDPAQDPARDPAGSRITDPEGQASFLDAVRTVVHGERIVEPRADSDSWEPPAAPGSARAASDDPEWAADSGDDTPAAATDEDLSDWLPGHWVAGPAPAWSPPAGRRREAPGSGKSEKSARKGRRGRTVEPAARRAVPGRRC